MDNTGLLPGERRTCRFTATRPGGWRFAAGAGAGTQWHQGAVAVTRNGGTVLYRSNGFQGCGEAIIQPGDVVSVEFVQAQGTVAASAYVAAGSGWSCTEKE